jgi:hypothetical protein
VIWQRMAGADADAGNASQASGQDACQTLGQIPHFFPTIVADYGKIKRTAVP